MFPLFSLFSLNHGNTFDVCVFLHKFIVYVSIYQNHAFNHKKICNGHIPFDEYLQKFGYKSMNNFEFPLVCTIWSRTSLREIEMLKYVSTIFYGPT